MSGEKQRQPTVCEVRVEAKQRGIRVTKKKESGKGYRRKDALLRAIAKDDKKKKREAKKRGEEYY